MSQSCADNAALCEEYLITYWKVTLVKIGIEHWTHLLIHNR